MASTANLNAPCTQQLCKKKQKPRQISYETAMTEAVDKSLSALGHSSKQAVYFHLENASKIEKQEIPCKIEEFTEAIEQLFGAGAKLIEMRIIEALHEKIQDFVYTPKKGNLTFTEYAASLRFFLKMRVL
jgi:hypothetical protein